MNEYGVTLYDSAPEGLDTAMALAGTHEAQLVTEGRWTQPETDAALVMTRSTGHAG